MNCFPYNMFGQALPLKHAQIEPARPKRWPDTKPQGPKLQGALLLRSTGRCRFVLLLKLTRL